MLTEGSSKSNGSVVILALHHQSDDASDSRGLHCYHLVPAYCQHQQVKNLKLEVKLKKIPCT